MKRIYTLLFGILPFLSIAQKNQGRVAFEETIKIEIDMKRFEGMPNAEEIKKMIPKSQVNKKELFFSAESQFSL